VRIDYEIVFISKASKINGTMCGYKRKVFVVVQSLIYLGLTAHMLLGIPAFQPLIKRQIIPYLAQFTSLGQIQSGYEVPKENLYGTNEAGSTWFWELHRRTVTEGKKAFFQMFSVSVSFIVLISMLILRLLGRFWHRKDKEEQRLGKLEMVAVQIEWFLQLMRAEMAIMKEAHDVHCTEFESRFQSVNKQIRDRDAIFIDVVNVRNRPMKMKEVDERCTSLENYIHAIEQVMPTVLNRLASTELWIQLLLILIHNEKTKEDIFLTEFQSIMKTVMDGDCRNADVQRHVDSMAQRMRAVDGNIVLNF
jgi:hypothetical protein